MSNSEQSCAFSNNFIVRHFIQNIFVTGIQSLDNVTLADYEKVAQSFQICSVRASEMISWYDIDEIWDHVNDIWVD